MTICPKCKGMGSVPVEGKPGCRVRCPACHGTGKTTDEKPAVKAASKKGN